jgi:hypothetical protein
MTGSVVVVVGGTVEVVVAASLVVLGATVVATVVETAVDTGAAVDDEAGFDELGRVVDRGTLSAGDATTDLSADAHDVARATTTRAEAPTERVVANRWWRLRAVLTSASLRRNRAYVATKLASERDKLAARWVLSRDCHTSLSSWSR